MSCNDLPRLRNRAGLLDGNRLEFTVIGEAANPTVRIEPLCKLLDEPVLLSAYFAACNLGCLLPLGRNSLQGINTPQKIFALHEAEQRRLL